MRGVILGCIGESCMDAGGSQHSRNCFAVTQPHEVGKWTTFRWQRLVTRRQHSPLSYWIFYWPFVPSCNAFLLRVYVCVCVCVYNVEFEWLEWLWIIESFRRDVNVDDAATHTNTHKSSNSAMFLYSIDSSLPLPSACPTSFSSLLLLFPPSPLLSFLFLYSPPPLCSFALLPLSCFTNRVDIPM